MNNFLFYSGFRRTWLQTYYILNVNLVTLGKLIRWPELRFSGQWIWEWNSYFWKLSQRLLKHVNKIMQHSTQNTMGTQLMFPKLFLSPSFLPVWRLSSCVTRLKDKIITILTESYICEHTPDIWKMSFTINNI